MGKTIRIARHDRPYYICVYTFVIIMSLTVLYPVIYIVSASFSSPTAVASGKVKLWPVDFSIISYQAIFKHSRVWLGYRNTIFYTFFGTLNKVLITVMCAYPLSRRDLPGHKFIMKLFVFTMYFSGGLIPTFLLMRDIGYYNTIWALIVPGSFSVYQMIITRTFIQNTIPKEMMESTRIDGCDDFQYFMKFVLPLSKAVIAVITLHYAVGYWNTYFDALIYLNDRKLQPLQLFLREILVMNQIDTSEVSDPDVVEELQNIAELLKFALIVVATLPILFIYPLIQKYFIQGVMIGSLKE